MPHQSRISQHFKRSYHLRPADFSLSQNQHQHRYQHQYRFNFEQKDATEEQTASPQKTNRLMLNKTQTIVFLSLVWALLLFLSA